MLSSLYEQLLSNLQYVYNALKNNPSVVLLIVYFLMKKLKNKSKYLEPLDSKVINIADQQQCDELLKTFSDTLVVIDFFSYNCGPCNKSAPKYSALSKNYPSHKFFKVNIDQNIATRNKYNINAVPTLLFIRNNEVVKIIQGWKEQEILDELDSQNKKKE